MEMVTDWAAGLAAPALAAKVAVAEDRMIAGAEPAGCVEPPESLPPPLHAKAPALTNKTEIRRMLPRIERRRA